jgi:hypothetical protein
MAQPGAEMVILHLFGTPGRDEPPENGARALNGILIGRSQSRDRDMSKGNIPASFQIFARALL